MKPLTHCPHCASVLIKKDIPEHLNSGKYTHCQTRCTVNYFQYFAQSYEDENLQYISLKTPQDKFNMYVYFNDCVYKNIAHIYSMAELKNRGTAFPILTLPADQIDLSKLDRLEERLSTLVLFT